MHDQSDAQLLRDYAEHGAETAFAEIVARHTDLVYSAALRQVYSPDLARDVTQSVFTDLARKARTVSANLSPEASLVGWLYRGTRFAARDLYRNETRRTQRERQAMAQLQPAPETPPDWDQLRPALDDAMSELDDTDRDAVLLRYFKNQDLRTVGATLGISDDAAQKRVSRAVERLREFFAKRGVTVGASGLAVVISANAVQAAPVGLALTISTAAALTGITLATTATVTVTKAIAMTALQKTIVTATIAVLAGAGIYEARQAAQLREQVQTLQRQQAPLVEQVAQLNQALANATNQLAAFREDNERLNRNSGELLKLRGEIARLQQAQRNEAAKQTSFIESPVWNPAELKNVGTATPMNAMQTLIWAFTSRTNVTVNDRANCVVTDANGPQPNDDALQQFITQNTKLSPAWFTFGFKVLATKEINQDEVQVLLDCDNKIDRWLKIFSLRNIGGEWKAVIFNWQDQDGNNSYLDFEKPRL